MAEELTGRCRGTSFATSFIQRPATTADHYDVDYITIDIFPNEVSWKYPLSVCADVETKRNGRRWYTCAGDGDPSCLGHHWAWTCELSVQIKHTTRRWISHHHNLLTAFKYRDRICEIYSAPTVLDIRSDKLPGPFLPDSFLGGGFASCLDHSPAGHWVPGLAETTFVCLRPCPSSPSWISRTGEFRSRRWSIACPHWPGLTRLEQFQLHFRFRPCSDYASPRPPPLTRTVLPVLTSLAFSGADEFLDYLFARTHFPLLKDVDIAFCPPVIFDVSQSPCSSVTRKRSRCSIRHTCPSIGARSTSHFLHQKGPPAATRSCYLSNAEAQFGTLSL